MWPSRRQHRSSAVRCLNMASAAQAEAAGSPQGAGSQRGPAAVRAVGSSEDPHDGCQVAPGNLAGCARHTEAELPCGSPTDSGRVKNATAAQQPASSSVGQALMQASAASLEPAVEAVTSPYSASPTCTGLTAQPECAAGMPPASSTTACHHFPCISIRIHSGSPSP